jgi:hypothetical protein
MLGRLRNKNAVKWIAMQWRQAYQMGDRSFVDRQT